MAGNFGRKLFWRIAETSVFGGIYFGRLTKACAIMIFIAKWLNPDEQRLIAEESLRSARSVV